MPPIVAIKAPAPRRNLKNFFIFIVLSVRMLIIAQMEIYIHILREKIENVKGFIQIE